MNRSPLRQWPRGVVALLLAAALGACTLVSPSPQVPGSITAMLQDSKPHCIGRYLIDLPSDYEFRTGGWGDVEFYFGRDRNVKTVYATVKRQTFTPESFQKAVQQRQEELQTTINRELKVPMLLRTERLGPQAILLRRHDSKYYDLTIKSEVHQLVGQRYVILEQESYPPEGFPFGAPNRSASIDPAPAEQRLKSLSASLKPYADPLRAPPGFCLQDVLFDFPHDAVSTLLYIAGTRRPDVKLELSYRGVFASRPNETLFDRIDKFNSSLAQALSEAGRRILRRGMTTLAGRPAQEYLSKLERPLHQHNFAAEVRAEDWMDPEQPYLLLTMNTGQRYKLPDGSTSNEGNSSLTDQEALALWDGVRASVRLRKSVYIGTLYCDFGRTCPQGGAWGLALKPNVPADMTSKYQSLQRNRTWHLKYGQVAPTPTGIPKDDLKWWEWELAIAN